MIAVHTATPGEAIVEMAAAIRRNGLATSPRGQSTIELIAPDLRIECPWQISDLTLEVAGRRLNPAIGAMEALTLVGQTTAPEQLMDKVPAFTKFADDGIFWGAYGQRVYGSLAAVTKTLTDDPDSRQAVVTIFDSTRDLHRNRRDIPCTIALHFMIRGDRLMARTVMRSNDAYLGLPYDIIQFCALQGAIAKALDIEMGPYLHTATSMHLYVKDVEKTIGMVDTSEPMSYAPLWSGKNIADVSSDARGILTGNHWKPDMTRFEKAAFKAVHGKEKIHG